MPWLGPNRPLTMKSQIGLGKRGERPVELGVVGIGVVEVRILRRLGQREEHALVLFGGELGRDVRIHEGDADEHGNAKQRGHRSVIERAPELAAVPIGNSVENAVDHPDEAAAQHLPAQQQRAHHRRQRDRDDAGNDHRTRQGESELAEQRPGDPAEKADRGVDGGERQGHRDHRTRDLAGADQRRLGRGPTLLDVPVNVLDDDDRVVDDEPDRQDHGEQGQEVEAEAQGCHDGPGADQRQRDGDDRDHHAAQAAEEQKDHRDDNGDGRGQRRSDLADRGPNEQGRNRRQRAF